MKITDISNILIQAENNSITIVLTLRVIINGFDFSYLYRNFLIQYASDNICFTLNEYSGKYKLDEDGLRITKPFIDKYFDVKVNDYFSELKEDHYISNK